LAVRATRCSDGSVMTTPSSAWPAAHATGPVQARIDLMLRLMQRP
jgi:hypothetical protein